MKKRIIFGLVLCAILAVMGIYPVKDIKAADSYDSYTKDQIQSHISKGEAPKQEGKVFAGWYNGDTPVRNLEEVTDSTLPKFVDEDVLTVKFQLLKDTTTTSAKTNIRFLTSVDSLKYKNVQFKVHLEQTVTARVTKVYTSVTADGETFTPKQAFSEDSKYIATVLVKDFEKESTADNEYGYFGRTITVTPMWTTLDGTIVEGTTRTMEVNDGLYDTEVNSGSTRTWHTLADGFAKVNESTEDVAIDLLRDVTHKSQIKVNVTNNQSGTITINGNGNTLTGDFEGAEKDAHFIYFEKHFGSINLNNLKIVHTNTAKNLMTFGSSSTSDITQTMAVNLKDVTMESESTNEYSIINAVQLTNLDITLDHVTLNWKTESSANNARAAIRYGNEGQEKTVNLVIKNESILNMSEAVGSGIVYATTGFNANTAIAVLDSEIIPYAGQYAYKGNSGDFQAVAYTAGRAYMALDAAVSAANASEEDVTIELLKDVEVSDSLTIKNENANVENIVLDGNNHTAVMSQPILICQKVGTVEVKDLKVDHRSNILFRCGDKDISDNYTLTVKFDNIYIESKSNNALIQAGHTKNTMNLNLNMVDVKLQSWTTTVAKNAIEIGTLGNPTVNLTMTDCLFNVSGATEGSKAIHATDKASDSGTINLINTEIIANADTPVYYNKMALSIDKDSSFYREKTETKTTQSVALVDGVQYSQLATAITALNGKSSNPTLNLVKDVTHTSQIKVNVTNNQSGTITINGNGHTLTGDFEGATDAHFIYFEKHLGTVNLNNLKIVHTNTAKNLMTFGDEGTADATQKMVVNLKNVEMYSNSTNQYSIINAVQLTNFDITLDNVILDWTNTTESDNTERAAIRYGSNKAPKRTVNLVIKDSTLDMSKAKDSGIVYAKPAILDGSTITVENSVITPYAGQDAYKGKAANFAPAVYMNKNGYTTLATALDVGNQLDEEVTLTLWNDVTISTSLTLKNENGKNVVLDGNGHTATVSAPILIYQEKGLVEIKDLFVTHNSNILFRIGSQGTYSEESKLKVNLTDINITSKSNQQNGLIQAGFATMQLDLNMTNVDLTWTPGSTHAKGAITVGFSGKVSGKDYTSSPTVNLAMTDCTIDATGASDGYGVYVESTATGNLVLNNTTITSNNAAVYDQKMKFTKDEATVLTPASATQVQMGDVIYNELFEAVADANKSQENVTISFLSDTVTFDENVDIANANGKTITIDGCDKKLNPANAAIRIYQKTGFVEVKNMLIEDHTQNLLFRIGDKENNYSKSDKLTVNLENLEITTSSNQKKGLIQAGYGAMQLDLNMKNVDLVWQPNDKYDKGAITVGCADLTATTMLNLTMTDCTLDVSGAKDAYAIYVEDNATGTIKLDGTNITTAAGQSVYNNNIPVYVTDKVTTVFFEGPEFYEIRVEDANTIDFGAYTTSLGQDGFEEHSTKEIGNAEYAVYKNDEMALYVNQFDSAMRIAYSNIDEAFLPETEKSEFTKVCDTKGYMVGVTAGDYENGMCFIYLLADGTFLVYDGGRNEADADHLYNLLCSIAKEHSIDKVVISNWMLTHAHGDHCGCWEPFFSKYAETVEIQSVMFNTTHTSWGDGVSGSLEKSVLNTVESHSPDTKLVRLHSGQDFWLADMKLEVLYTVEDLEPGTLTDYNDASTITRLTIGDKTILMTGDAATNVWELMCNTYGDALKSEYLQVPHHGTGPGGTIDAYNMIQPTYLLWPCGNTLYTQNLTKNGAINLHLLRMVGTGNSEIAGVYDATNNTGPGENFLSPAN